MKLKNSCDLSLCARPDRVVCFFVIREIEKQCDKQSDAPHEPPSPILFPDCGNNQRQTARTHAELWIPRSKCTSSDEWNQKPRFALLGPGRVGSRRPLGRCNAPQLSATS